MLSRREVLATVALPLAFLPGKASPSPFVHIDAETSHVAMYLRVLDEHGADTSERVHGLLVSQGLAEVYHGSLLRWERVKGWRLSLREAAPEWARIEYKALFGTLGTVRV